MISSRQRDVLQIQEKKSLIDFEIKTSFESVVT
jgi:hypothetical protein